MVVLRNGKTPARPKTPTKPRARKSKKASPVHPAPRKVVHPAPKKVAPRPPSRSPSKRGGSRGRPTRPPNAWLQFTKKKYHEVLGAFGGAVAGKTAADKAENRKRFKQTMNTLRAMYWKGKGKAPPARGSMKHRKNHGTASAKHRRRSHKLAGAAVAKIMNISRTSFHGGKNAELKKKYKKMVRLVERYHKYMTLKKYKHYGKVMYAKMMCRNTGKVFEGLNVIDKAESFFKFVKGYAKLRKGSKADREMWAKYQKKAAIRRGSHKAGGSRKARSGSRKVGGSRKARSRSGSRKSRSGSRKVGGSRKARGPMTKKAMVRFIQRHVPGTTANADWSVEELHHRVTALKAEIRRKPRSGSRKARSRSGSRKARSGSRKVGGSRKARSRSGSRKVGGSRKAHGSRKHKPMPTTKVDTMAEIKKLDPAALISESWSLDELHKRLSRARADHKMKKKAAKAAKTKKTRKAKSASKKAHKKRGGSRKKKTDLYGSADTSAEQPKQFSLNYLLSAM